MFGDIHSPRLGMVVLGSGYQILGLFEAFFIDMETKKLHDGLA